MAIMRKNVIRILFFIIMLHPLTSYASWVGPIEMIQGGWGNNNVEFGFQPGDTKDQFPWDFLILADGKIIIDDWVNNRFKIYLSSGRHLKFIPEPGYGLYGLDKDIIVTFKWNNQLKCNNISAYNITKEKWEWINDKSSFKYLNNINLAISNYVIFSWDGKNGSKYSKTGELLKTYDAKPLELGVVQEISLGGGNYENIIEYPDKKWKVKGLCAKYMRDACGALYCVDNAIVIRYDDEGKDVAFVGMPDEKIEQLPNPNPPGSGVDAPTKVLEQYGSPVLAPNGDVYTWKRSPDKYSILKWVWVDGPECPQYLDVTPTKNSLKFTWQKPTKDADKVTGYQLLQSYNICGPFKQAALLKKDQLSFEEKDVKKGETYYYIVKAIRGKDYSGNSNKVCGQIE